MEKLTGGGTVTIGEEEQLNEMAYDMDLEDIKYFYPFSDETTMNVLLWKYKYNKRLPFLQMNIDDIDNVKEYYESNYENEKEVILETAEDLFNLLCKINPNLFS